MTERGTIIDIQGNKAVLQLGRTTRCAGCKVCVHGKNNDQMIAEAWNSAQARIGDRVEMQTPEINVVRESFLLFIAPMLLFFVTFMAVTSRFSTPAAFIAAALTAAVPIIFLRFREKKGRYTPVITRIVDTA